MISYRQIPSSVIKIEEVQIQNSLEDYFLSAVFKKKTRNYQLHTILGKTIDRNSLHTTYSKKIAFFFRFPTLIYHQIKISHLRESVTTMREFGFATCPHSFFSSDESPPQIWLHRQHRNRLSYDNYYQNVHHSSLRHLTDTAQAFLLLSF